MQIIPLPTWPDFKAFCETWVKWNSVISPPCFQLSHQKWMRLDWGSVLKVFWGLERNADIQKGKQIRTLGPPHFCGCWSRTGGARCMRQSMPRAIPRHEQVKGVCRSVITQSFLVLGGQYTAVAWNFSAKTIRIGRILHKSSCLKFVHLWAALRPCTDNTERKLPRATFSVCKCFMPSSLPRTLHSQKAQHATSPWRKSKQKTSKFPLTKALLPSWNSHPDTGRGHIWSSKTMQMLHLFPVFIDGGVIWGALVPAK